MAVNKPYGDNSRIGAVKGRSQVYNPKIDAWVKRDSVTGRFMNVKTSNNIPFKGVRKEKWRDFCNEKSILVKAFRGDFGTTNLEEEYLIDLLKKKLQQ